MIDREGAKVEVTMPGAGLGGPGTRPPGAASPKAGGERRKGMTPEQREELRKRRESMTPEQREESRKRRQAGEGGKPPQ